MLRKEPADLNINKPSYWTDRETVLHYLANVANRVEEVENNLLVQHCNHVPGALNLTDESTTTTFRLRINNHKSRLRADLKISATNKEMVTLCTCTSDSQGHHVLQDVSF